MTVIPLYGRDYKSKAEVLADWNAGKDFIVADAFNKYDGKPCNKEDTKGETITVRYKKLRNICIIKN